jgi:hypothetical protein
LAKLKKQQEYELAQLDKKLANDKALLKYENGLKKNNSVTDSNTTSNKTKVTNSNTRIGNGWSNYVKTGTSNTIDMNSVLSLGYGPISESYLDQLVSQGKVVEYVENGKIKFKKATPTAPKVRLK